jgi:DNA-binding LacI/PurR family transcriptional regulator
VKDGGTETEADGFSQKKPSPGGTIRKGNPGRLLFVSALPLSHERHSGVEVFAELLDQLGTKGWEVMHRVENFTSAKKPRRSWDELLRLAQPDAMVVLGGTPVLGMWAAERKIRSLFLGGDAGASGVPVLAVRVGTMLRHALGHLVGLGHRRIVMPLCGRSPGFVANCRSVAEETMIATGGGKDGIAIVETAYATPQVVVDLLRRQWRKQPPDALIFLDWREFVAASSYFVELGIAIPRDVSVVVLSQNATMAWHMPRITHFEHPVKPMARMISKWVTEGNKPPAPQGSIEVRARWVEGESVAARK